MLVLSRHEGEKVIIQVPGSDGPVEIGITIVEIERNRVRLGFTCPKEYPIYREELRQNDPPSREGM